jgi:uncharacterized protein (DUF983 family)
MSETNRRLKVNKRLAEQSCSHCNAALAFGQDAVVCLKCEKGYHAECWDKKGGCATAGCENAAVPRLDSQAAQAAKEVPAGKRECPHCGRLYRTGMKFCPSCKKAPTPSGEYHGPKTNAPGAVAALVFGIVAIPTCFVFGIVAIVKANEAHKEIARDPTLGGAGMATAGKVIGIVAIVLHALLIMARAAAR